MSWADLKEQEVFMAYFEDESLPHVGICMRTWRPCFVLRGKARFLPRFKKGVVPKEKYCTHCITCLDTFCTFNHTRKNYLEMVLTPEEQKWFKENWLDIVDECKAAYFNNPEGKNYAKISLKPKAGQGK